MTQKCSGEAPISPEHFSDDCGSFPQVAHTKQVFQGNIK